MNKIIFKSTIRKSILKSFQIVSYTFRLIMKNHYNKII